MLCYSWLSVSVYRAVTVVTVSIVLHLAVSVYRVVTVGIVLHLAVSQCL